MKTFRLTFDRRYYIINIKIVFIFYVGEGGSVGMELEILKNEEKRMNMIMSLFLDVIPVVAVTYVLLFNGGSGRDAIALVMVAASLLIKVFEKKLGTYAKYLYISVLPLFGAVTLVVGTPGVFGAMVEAYFLVLFLAVRSTSFAMKRFK